MSPQTNLIVTICLGMFGVHKFMQKKIGMGLLYLFTGGLFGIGWIVDSIQAIINFSKSRTGLSLSSASNQPLLTLPEISPTGLIMRNGEVCHYQNNASVVKTKNIVVGHSGGHVGASVRIAKGLTLHTGSSKGTPIRQNVSDYTPGMLYITSQRVVFLCEKNAFDKPYSAISAVNISGNTLLIQFGNVSRSMEISDPDYLNKVFTLALNTYTRNSNESPV